jgi:hypothetical protein
VARESLGHGSPTSPTAGGRLINNARFYGLAKEVAREGPPLLRIVAYKVFSDAGCPDVDTLAAYDDDIEDGVDVLFLSLSAPPYLIPIAIGTFHAVQNDIVFLCSAGHDEPSVGQRKQNVGKLKQNRA